MTMGILAALRVLLLVWIMVELSLASAHAGHEHEEHEEGVNLRAKSLILAKVYSLLIVFFATFVAGISPYFFRWNEAFLVLGTQFAGGVFLATAMIHFLGDSHDVFRRLKPESYYAYSEMLAVVGYLLTMLADVAIQRSQGRRFQPDAKVTADVENSADCEPSSPPPQCRRVRRKSWQNQASVTRCCSYWRCASTPSSRALPLAWHQRRATHGKRCGLCRCTRCSRRWPWASRCCECCPTGRCCKRCCTRSRSPSRRPSGWPSASSSTPPRRAAPPTGSTPSPWASPPESSSTSPSTTCSPVATTLPPRWRSTAPSGAGWLPSSALPSSASSSSGADLPQNHLLSPLLHLSCCNVPRRLSRQVRCADLGDLVMIFRKNVDLNLAKCENLELEINHP